MAIKELESSNPAVPEVLEPEEGPNEELVDEAVTWIREKNAETVQRGLIEIGEYLLTKFFKGDPKLASSKNSTKDASFRALAERCGTAELPMSKTWLNNSVRIAAMSQQLPAADSPFRMLPPSHQEALLALGDSKKVDKLAKQATNKKMTVRALREHVAEELEKTPKEKDGRGRPPIPVALKALQRAAKAFSADAGSRPFTAGHVKELEGKKRTDALKLAKGLAEQLNELLEKLEEKK